MADKIKINTGSLNSTSEEVNAHIQKLRQEMEAMSSGVNQMNSMWTGEAHNAFVKAFQDDMNTFNAIIRNIETIYRYETNAKKKYEDCERQVQELVASIKV